jgi:hypothetical protein
MSRDPRETRCAHFTETRVFGEAQPAQAEAQHWARFETKIHLCISKKAFACFDPDRSLAGKKKGFSAVWPSKRAIDVAAKMFALHVEQNLQYEKGDSGRQC